MVRIAPFSESSLMLFHTLNTQARIADRQLQLGTGMVSQQYSGISRTAPRLISLETGIQRSRQFMRNIDSFDQRLALMDLNLEQIDIATRDIRAAIESVINFPKAHSSDLRSIASSARTSVRDMLNAKIGGRFLFAGTRIDKSPVDLNGSYTPMRLIEADGNTIDDTFYQAYYTQVLGNTMPYAQGTFYQQIFFEKTGGLPGGPLPGDMNNPTKAEFVAEDAGLWQYYVDRMNSTQMLAKPKVDYYGGDTGIQSVRADESFEVKINVQADDLALQQILSALDAVANLPDDVPDDTFERAIMVKARDMLDQALGSDATATFRDINDLRMEISSARETLKRTHERHETFMAFAEGSIADIENVDTAEVAARLMFDRTALEASFATIGRMQSLTLVNYL